MRLTASDFSSVDRDTQNGSLYCEPLLQTARRSIAEFAPPVKPTTIKRPFNFKTLRFCSKYATADQVENYVNADRR